MTGQYRSDLPAPLRRCVRCVMDDTVPGIRFDADGVCSYCHLHDRLDRAFPTGPEGRRILERFADRMRRDGKNRPYDCVVGVSGGRDTSYCLHYVKRELGLRPLAVHFDNGWDSETAKTNLARLCDALDVELHTVIMDWPDSRELTDCTIRAGVPYIDVTDDIGIARSL
ncbi:MAG TPA: adenine nucleotide alpha hydrolase, partial [Candidatus Hydrogenedentes bacterium]|nr:adenine nucleotide alpha hydrolase [Candidatus Hydrogenedentota bacterium]